MPPISSRSLRSSNTRRHAEHRSLRRPSQSPSSPNRSPRILLRSGPSSKFCLPLQRSMLGWACPPSDKGRGRGPLAASYRLQAMTRQTMGGAGASFSLRSPTQAYSSGAEGKTCLEKEREVRRGGCGWRGCTRASLRRGGSPFGGGVSCSGGPGCGGRSGVGRTCSR